MEDKRLKRPYNSNVLGKRSWLVDYLLSSQKKKEMAVVNQDNPQCSNKLEKPDLPNCQPDCTRIGKNMPQTINVLKHIEVRNGNIIKQVSDGETWIQGIFTPSAVLKFTNCYDECSTPDWNRSKLLVNQYYSQFVHLPDLHQCEFQLFIEDFQLVCLEHGFHYKNDIEFIMDHPKIQQLAVTNLQLIKALKIDHHSSSQNQGCHGDRSMETDSQTSQSHNLSMLKGLEQTSSQSFEACSSKQINELELTSDQMSRSVNATIVEDLSGTDSNTFQDNTMEEADGCRKEDMLARSNIHAEKHNVRTQSLRPDSQIPSTKLILSSFITSVPEKKIHNSIPAWKTKAVQKKWYNDVIDEPYTVSTGEEDCVTKSSSYKKDVLNSPEVVPQPDKGPVDKTMNGRNIKTFNVHIQVGDSLGMPSHEINDLPRRPEAHSISCQVGDSLAMGPETQAETVNGTRKENTVCQEDIPTHPSPSPLETCAPGLVSVLPFEEAADSEDGQRFDSSDSNELELGMIGTDVQSDEISKSDDEQPNYSEVDAAVCMSLGHAQSTQFDHITFSQVPMPDFPVSPLKEKTEVFSDKNPISSELAKERNSICERSRPGLGVGDRDQLCGTVQHEHTSNQITRCSDKDSSIDIQEEQEQQRLDELILSSSNDLCDIISVAERDETERLSKLRNIMAIKGDFAPHSSRRIAKLGQKCAHDTAEKSPMTLAGSLTKDSSFSVIDNWQCGNERKDTGVPVCPPPRKKIPDEKGNKDRTVVSLVQSDEGTLENKSKLCSTSYTNITKLPEKEETTLNIIQEDGLILPEQDVETPVKKRKLSTHKDSHIVEKRLETLVTETGSGEENRGMCLRGEKALPMCGPKASKRNTSEKEKAGQSKKSRFDTEVLFKKESNKPITKVKHKLFSENVLMNPISAVSVKDDCNVVDAYSALESVERKTEGIKVRSTHVCEGNKMGALPMDFMPPGPERDPDEITCSSLTHLRVDIPSSESVVRSIDNGTRNEGNGSHHVNKKDLDDDKGMSYQSQAGAKDINSCQVGQMMDLGNGIHTAAKKQAWKPHRFNVKKKLSLNKYTSKGKLGIKHHSAPSSYSLEKSGMSTSVNEQCTRESQLSPGSTSGPSNGKILTLPTTEYSPATDHPLQATTHMTSEESSSFLPCENLLRIEELLQKEADFLKENRVYTKTFQCKLPLLKNVYGKIKKQTREALDL